MRKPDRMPGAPIVVVADGAQAFVRAYAAEVFAQSDFIVVIPRTSDSEQLESASQQLVSLSQWYRPIIGAAGAFHETPRGVTGVVLQKE